MRGSGIFLLFIGGIFASQNSLASPQSDINQNESQRGAYFSGVYRDNFVDLLKKSKAAVKVRIASSFNQLFYGNDSTERVYYPVAPDMAYIKDVNNKDVRTEGMSYGMMICVLLDK